MKLAKVMKLTKAMKMIIPNEISVNDLEKFFDGRELFS